MLAAGQAGVESTLAEAKELGDRLPSEAPMQPDWTREKKSFWQWDPSRSLLASIRAYQHARSSGGLLAGLVRRLAVLRHHFWSIVTGAEIPLNTQLGGGLLMPHPNGIVIHPEVRIGVNCMIFQQVTLGIRDNPDVPWVGDHVDIGAGAKILGGVRIGDHARIGANSVVLHDVAASTTVVGAPARPVGQAR